MTPSKYHFCLGFCYRLRHLLWRAPYSTFDFSMSLAFVLMGGHLLMFPDLFTRFAGMYLPMQKVMSQSFWAITFLICGGYGLLIVLWPRRPLFLLRLLARMGVAFCLLSFALNNLSNSPPPISGMMYAVLAFISLWSIVRTRCDG